VRWAACAVAVLVLAADQVSKSLVLAARPGPGGGGFVSVRLVRNTGASFGVGGFASRLPPRSGGFHRWRLHNPFTLKGRAPSHRLL